MGLSTNKLKAAILYFANHTSRRYLGKVKLMKLLYFLDFTHVKRYGVPVLNDEYYHLQMGPIPTVTMNLIEELVSDPDNSRLSDAIDIELPPNSRMQRIVPLREFTDEDSNIFTKSELNVLKEVASEFKNSQTDELIEKSHQESPWEMTFQTEKIGYELAGYDKDTNFTPEEIKELTSF